MYEDPSDTTTICPVRLGTDEPWTNAEVSFGERSLVIEPLDAVLRATWVPYADVTAVDEVDTGAGAPEIETALRDGRRISMQLDAGALDTMLGLLAASREPDPVAQATPALFGFGDDEATRPRTPQPSPQPSSPLSPMPAPGAPAAPDAPDVTPVAESAPSSASAPAAEAAPVAEPAPAPEPAPVPEPTQVAAPAPQVAGLFGTAPDGARPEMSTDGYVAVDARSSEKPPAPPGSDDPDDRVDPGRRKIVLGAALAVAVVLLVGVLAAVVLGGGDDPSSDEPAAETSDEPATTDAPETSDPGSTDPESSTTGPSATDAPTFTGTDALDVRLLGVQAGPDAAVPALYASFDVSNIADQQIVSYDLELSVRVETGSGAQEWVLPLACSSTPLEPGDRRTGEYVPGNVGANAPQLAECTVAGWAADPGVPAQGEVVAAIAGGATPTTTLRVVEVTFADGTTADGPTAD